LFRKHHGLVRKEAPSGMRGAKGGNGLKWPGRRWLSWPPATRNARRAPSSWRPAALTTTCAFNKRRRVRTGTGRAPTDGMTRGPREQQHLAGPTCRCGFSTPLFRFCRCSVALARGERERRPHGLGGVRVRLLTGGPRVGGTRTSVWSVLVWNVSALVRMFTGEGGAASLRRSRDRSLPAARRTSRRCGL